jgi:hypothetical protein
MIGPNFIPCPWFSSPEGGLSSSFASFECKPEEYITAGMEGVGLRTSVRSSEGMYVAVGVTGIFVLVEGFFRLGFGFAIKNKIWNNLVKSSLDLKFFG